MFHGVIKKTLAQFFETRCTAADATWFDCVPAVCRSVSSLMVGYMQHRISHVFMRLLRQVKFYAFYRHSFGRMTIWWQGVLSLEWSKNEGSCVLSLTSNAIGRLNVCMTVLMSLFDFSLSLRPASLLFVNHQAMSDLSRRVCVEWWFLIVVLKRVQIIRRRLTLTSRQMRRILQILAFFINLGLLTRCVPVIIRVNSVRCGKQNTRVLGCNFVINVILFTRSWEMHKRHTIRTYQVAGQPLQATWCSDVSYIVSSLRNYVKRFKTCITDPTCRLRVTTSQKVF